MAVKKAATPKKSSAPKTAAPKKAAPKKAAPKKATTKKSTSKKSTMPAQATAKPAGAKKAAAKKAPAIKLSDAQTRVLGSVQSASEAGYAGGKGEGKILESLLKKKLVKRGKKVDGVGPLPGDEGRPEVHRRARPGRGRPAAEPRPGGDGRPRASGHGLNP